MKTLVTHAHEPGPAVNGHDGCHARTSNDGMCPGVRTAEWLNSLGDDDVPYVANVTCGAVRQNYLRSVPHIVAQEPEIAALNCMRQDLQAQLKRVEARLASIKPASVKEELLK